MRSAALSGDSGQVAPGDHLDDVGLHSVQMAAMAEGARIASKEFWKR